MFNEADNNYNFYNKEEIGMFEMYSKGKIEVVERENENGINQGKKSKSCKK